MPFHRFCGIFLFILLLMSAMYACSDINKSDTENNPDSTQTLKIIVHQRADPFTLHPAQGADEMRAITMQCTQRFIIRTDMETSEPLPDLVTELPGKINGGLEQLYTLKSGIRWDDGSELTVKDVIFTVKAGLCPGVDNPHTKQLFKAIEDIRTDTLPDQFVLIFDKDVFTNQFALKDVPVLQASFYDASGILNDYTLQQIKAMLDGDNIPAGLQKWIARFCSSRFGHEPKYHNGLGDYSLVDWEDDRYWTLVKKQNIRDNEGFNTAPDTIVFRVIKDEQAIIAAFREQSIDVGNMLSDRQIRSLLDDPLFCENYWYDTKPTSNYTYAAMNMRPVASGRTALFNDLNVRRAMTRLSPVSDILKIVFNGRRIRASGPACTGTWYCDTGITPIRFAPDSAKALLKLAGWLDSDNDGILDHVISGNKKDFSFTITYLNVQEEWADMARILKERYESAGMKVQLEALDPAAWYNKAITHDFDMLLGAWNTDPVIDDPGQLWLQSSWLNKGHNFPGFGNSRSDSLIYELNHARDKKEYLNLSHQLQRQIVADCPMIFLAQGVRIVAVHKRLKRPPVYKLMPGIYLPEIRRNNDSNLQ